MVTDNHLLIDCQCNFIEIQESIYSLEEIDLVFKTYIKIQLCDAHLSILNQKFAVKIITNLISFEYIIAWGYVIVQIYLNNFYI